MKKLFSLLVLSAVVACATLPAIAADRGQQKQATTIATNTASNVIALPIGDTGRFDPTWLVLVGGFGGTTQTVSYVAQGYTGTVATVTAAGVTAITNVPTLFNGDKLIMTSSGTTNTITATVIGRVTD